MSYLHPPPGDAPVVVVKDVGGYVDEYGRQTARYFESKREVRLHECRSACTIALALPNVCVFPDSVLKFHKAYNPITNEANEPVSAAMMAAYPAAVRQRLGELTRNYKVLTGSELIRLGIRDCNRPASPRVLVARAKPNLSAPENPMSNAFGSLVAALTPQSAQPAGVAVKVASIRTPSAPKDDAGAASPGVTAVPTPPARPAELAGIALPVQDAKLVGAKSQEAKSAALKSASEIPAGMPDAAKDPPEPLAQATALAPQVEVFPPEPPVAESNWRQPIAGSAPVLFSARFVPWSYRLAGRS